eukprot:1059317-Prymnesium_polylepis.2
MHTGVREKHAAVVRGGCCVNAHVFLARGPPSRACRLTSARCRLLLQLGIGGSRRASEENLFAGSTPSTPAQLRPVGSLDRVADSLKRIASELSENNRCGRDDSVHV